MQQQYLGALGKPRCYTGDRQRRIIGLAGYQQAVDRALRLRGFGRDGVVLGLFLFDQGQAAGLLISLQPLPVAQDQAHCLARACQAAGPQAAQAAGAENMPGAAHMRFATRYNEPAF